MKALEHTAGWTDRSDRLAKETAARRARLDEEAEKHRLNQIRVRDLAAADEVCEGFGSIQGMGLSEALAAKVEADRAEAANEVERKRQLDEAEAAAARQKRKEQELAAKQRRWVAMTNSPCIYLLCFRGSLFSGVRLDPSLDLLSGVSML